jgi:LCCL domain
MKAVQELVTYFDRRGKLSARQIRKLLEGGFLAADAPTNMVDLGDDIGATFYFRVSGNTNGPVWGTDIYAGDSALATAAVHAGLVKPGETALIKVTVVPPLTQYHGSERNGVTSNNFGRFGKAYRLSAIQE